MTAQELPLSVHAFRNDILAHHDATALAELIRSGAVSVQEVVDAALARAGQVEPFINGIAASGFDLGRDIARQGRTASGQVLDGFFAGVPTFIKDNTNIQGLPTGHGSAAITPSPARRTSPYALQMLAQGFVCLGKSTLPEFGFNATTEPAHGQPTRNPWNLAYSSGASSGGSAALVAAGVVPLAHANDGGGSIRIPAACCGLVGLKPSRGRLVDNDAVKALPVNIVSDGVMTRSVRDTANFYAEAESWFHNPGLPRIGKVEGPGNRALKIGLVVDSINGHRTDNDTRNTVEATARQLEKLGHHIVPMAVPVAPSFPGDFALYWAMLAFGVEANGRRLMDPTFDKTRVDGLTHGLDRMFRKQFYRLPGALWRLHRSHHDYAKAMTGFDALLSPVLGHTTPEIGYLSPDLDFDTLFARLNRYVGFTPLANATGAPALSLPMGRTDHNLPIAVQLMARHGDECSLLELAFALEDAAPWPMLGH